MLRWAEDERRATSTFPKGHVCPAGVARAIEVRLWQSAHKKRNAKSIPVRRVRVGRSCPSCSTVDIRGDVRHVLPVGRRADARVGPLLRLCGYRLVRPIAATALLLHGGYKQTPGRRPESMNRPQDGRTTPQ